MRSYSLILSLSALFAACQAALGTPLLDSCPTSSPSPRIVAIGDVHGDLEALETILREANLRDGRGNWTGGNSILVQTGDLLDRGKDDRGVLELLMALEPRARRAGGKVQVLLGNHEVMNLFGDLRYVSAESFGRFADEKSEKRRESAYRDYQRFLKAKARFLELPVPVMDHETRKEWDSEHTAGYLEHREAFSASGRYGKWLRKKSAIVREGGYLFLHGGLNPVLPGDVDKLNEIVAKEIETYDQIRAILEKQALILPFHDFTEILTLAQTYADHIQAKRAPLEPAEEDLLQLFEALAASPSWLSVHPDGPLWFRGFARWTEAEGAPLAEQLASRFQACGFVVGHTPQLERGIQSRFNGLVFLIDTGMLRGYYEGGIPSALEIGETGFFALYPNSNRTVLGPFPQNTP